MAELITSVKGGMFDSTKVVETPGGFPRGDKAVDSAFFAKMISSFYADGVLRDGGFAVTPATGDDGAMAVKISGGVAWVRGYMAWLEEEITVELSAGAEYAVLLRLDIPAGEFNIIVTDETSGLPKRTDHIVDLVLAEISVPSGAAEIDDEMITDTREDSELCGYVSNAVDGLGEALHAQDSSALGGIEADGYLLRDGGTMTGTLKAASDSSGASCVRNISYGTTVPRTLADGEIFIQIE